MIIATIIAMAHSCTNNEYYNTAVVQSKFSSLVLNNVHDRISFGAYFRKGAYDDLYA